MILHVEFNNIKLKETKGRMVLPGAEGWGNGRCQPRVQPFSYKMNEFWGFMYRMVTILIILYYVLEICLEDRS